MGILRVREEIEHGANCHPEAAEAPSERSDEMRAGR